MKVQSSLSTNSRQVFWRKVRRFLVRRLENTGLFELPVEPVEVAAADWTRGDMEPERNKGRVHETQTGGRKLTINWVIPPMSVGSGGHTTIFRMVQYLEKQGHTCRLYVYLHDKSEMLTMEQMRMNYKAGWPQMQVELEAVEAGMKPADVMMATSWETAYPVFNVQTNAAKVYFVQDFEPAFFPMGSNYILAENTYRFGFKGITAGGWLKKKLSKEYGMECGEFNFGSDTGVYRYENDGPRKDVFFYARPQTARRGFELGCLVLEEFAKQHPDATIHLAGADVGNYKLPFPFVNHGVVAPAELNKLYNQCAAGLVLSLTNMSLLPLEMLGSGCIPVVNDGPNNRLVSDNPFIEYVEPSPAAMARRLDEMVSRKDQPEHAHKAASSVMNTTWEAAGAQVEALLMEYAHGK